MLQQKSEQWQEIEKISQKMRDLAVENQSLDDFSNDKKSAEESWYEISCLEVKRVELLEDFFSNSFSVDESEFLSQKIQHVLALDKELASINQSIQKEISFSFSKIGFQQRAAVAYGNVQSS